MVSRERGVGGARAQRRVPRPTTSATTANSQRVSVSSRHCRTATMRVAIEAASLALSSGGLARYTSELSLALARCFPGRRILPGLRPAFPHARRRARPICSAAADRAMPWSAAGGSGDWRARCAGCGADLVHGPDFAVPYLPRRPSVLTLHDLSPWMDERWHHAAARVRRRTPVLLELGWRRWSITPGESGAARQAIERFRLRPERVVAVPEAAAPWFRPVAARPARVRISCSSARWSRARISRR